ncbi:hypothetical protein TSUD_131260 [Trifolium subterraneum]|uniref:Leucine-rich repeat-containing N-terminal plant-type domain-containing protein n=1 Tax=Trifolium subterraneum TaxID=3900 RepID=A0A2Z6P6L6_TRISU|nr:hypothetical protein TSUD_131260 [Trifolium subterraneum]
MSNNDHGLVRCNEKDHKTLLIFRKGINDSNGQLSTWSTEKDCCTWEGVHCDNITGRVIELDLQAQSLKGEINFFILKLEFLSYLDLSYNEFDVIRIPSIQDNITHTSNLLYLDFSFNLYVSSLSPVDTLHMDNLDWLSPLSSLKYLNLSGIDLHKETNWLQAVNTLPSLLELHMSDCNLNNFMLNPSIEYLNLYSLVTLDLSNKNFTSRLPNWFFNLTKDLTYLDLHSSNIHGEIPSSLLNLQNLRFLDLSYNQLQGSIPDEALNLGENKFSGTIPINMSQNLKVVILRDNQFEGTIPPQLFNLPYLFHLDLAHNKLSGSIPECVYNLTHMVTVHEQSWVDTPIELFTKGQQYYVYDTNPYRRTIDLSANNLYGDVPLELFRLVQLQTLNLSHNNFIGTISNSIGGMKNMESLDLSNNKLCGEIPQSITLLNFLGYLNLSYNIFNGKIPIGTQLQSFDSSSFIGNPKLCGAPLNNCTTVEENPKTAMPSTDNEDDDSIRESLNLGMGAGFAVGFWGICGSLVLIRKWRQAYYRFLNGVGDKLYVTLMVKLNSFHRK